MLRRSFPRHSERHPRHSETKSKNLTLAQAVFMKARFFVPQNDGRGRCLNVTPNAHFLFSIVGTQKDES
jgi:hypothetical protein